MKIFLVLFLLYFQAVLVSAVVDLANNLKISDQNLFENIKTNFVVSIMSLNYPGLDDSIYRSMCGASIISEDYVLTSADCASRMWKSDRLVAGSIFSKVGGSLHLIEETIIHENYSNCSTFNVALVKVTPPFDLGFYSKVSKIALNSDSLLDEPSLVFMGWGATEMLGNMGYNYSERLQLAKFDVISNDYCNKYRLNVDVKQMCAQGYVGKGICQRDAGGPLVFLETETGEVKLKLVGIATERHSCGNGFPDVYTKVAFFLPWINKTCGCIVSL